MLNSPWSSLATEAANQGSNETFSSETESPNGIVNTPEFLDLGTSIPEYDFDLGPNGCSQNFPDLGSMDQFANSQVQELGGYSFSGWSKDLEDQSPTRKLSQRLFPRLPGAGLVNLDHVMNIDKVSYRIMHTGSRKNH